jgi:PKD repeat protein
MYRRLLSLAFAALLATACDSTNPVEPPATPNPGGSSDAVTVTVTVTSGTNQVQVGTTAATILTVTARKGDGSPVADGTEVVVNTSLGYFSLDGTGKPVQLVKQNLTGGSATVTFFPGKDVGTANILAQVGTSTGKLNLAVVEAAVPPVAEFAFETSALSALFTDMSTGNPTAWDWDFGDGDGTNRQNPGHTYAEAGTYTVSLTVTAPGGQSTKRKFVTVEPGEPLLADFSYTANGKTVIFSDTSVGTPTSWTWDFGDGGTSTQRNPRHTYKTTGTYTVSLTVTNAFRVSDTTSQFLDLTTGAPVASFQSQTDGLRALFTDTSTGNPTSWSWDFGDCSNPPSDGCQSNAQNPSHEYKQAGTYRVTLTASNAAGSSSKVNNVTVSLGDAPKADFTYQVSRLNAAFTDTSTGTPTGWTWSFGDGSSSTEQNPVHSYAQAGTYTVTLTARNAGGSSTKSQFVTVANPPTANFSFQVSGLQATFTDSSTGNPTAWSWDFGDGSASTAQSPSHQYAQAGSYTVRLTVSNAAGSNSVSKVVSIADDRPAVKFCYQRQGMMVSFFDGSTHSPTSWIWTFGDCSVSPSCQSTLQNPSHTYTSNGTYTVNLTVSNDSGSASRSTTVQIDGSTDASQICLP